MAKGRSPLLRMAQIQISRGTEEAERRNVNGKRKSSTVVVGTCLLFCISGEAAGSNGEAAGTGPDLASSGVSAWPILHASTVQQKLWQSRAEAIAEAKQWQRSPGQQWIRFSRGRMAGNKKE
jgi:hypothetical protein